MQPKGSSGPKNPPSGGSDVTAPQRPPAQTFAERAEAVRFTVEAMPKVRVPHEWVTVLTTGAPPFRQCQLCGSTEQMICDERLNRDARK